MPTGRARSCLFNKQELQQVLSSMAADLAPWVRRIGSVVLVGVLRRGAPLADALAGQLVSEQGCAPPLRLDLRVKRYADDLTLLYPDTHMEEDPRQAEMELAGRHVLVVDDVLYSGHSILKVVEHLARKQPASIRVATFLFKPGAYQKNDPIDYVGLEVGNEFLIGYGLDYDGLGRNLPCIYKIED